MEAFSPATASGSSKRGRTPSTSTSQTVSCVVDGCKSDLTKCRDYHRRHKVCEVHSKTPCVIIRGLQQRFCQQCSRFHSLQEFDEGKRSCRKRLEGHNRRRRKPQHEPMPVNPGNFLSANQGSRFFPFNNQPMNPATTSVVSSTSTWSEALKSESNPTLFSNSISPASYSHAYKSRQFPFLQGPDSPFVHHSSSSSNNKDQEILCNGLNQVIDSESSRALSLLSSPSVETPEMGLGRAMDHCPMGPSHRAHNIGPYHTNTMMTNLRNNSDRLCPDVFQQGRPEYGSSASGGHQTIYFPWE